jgi:hypothetical protein
MNGSIHKCHPFQAWTPLQSLTNTCRKRSMPPAPVKVWCPLTFCLYKGATFTRWHPTIGYAAFSGFLNLSTLCSPLYLPGLFHPGSVFGVFPSGYCSLGGAVHAFARRSPHKVELNEPPFQGFSHQTRFRIPGQAVRLASESVTLLGFSPPGFTAT